MSSWVLRASLLLAGDRETILQSDYFNKDSDISDRNLSLAQVVIAGDLSLDIGSDGLIADIPSNVKTQESLTPSLHKHLRVGTQAHKMTFNKHPFLPSKCPYVCEGSSTAAIFIAAH